MKPRIRSVRTWVAVGGAAAVLALALVSWWGPSGEDALAPAERAFLRSLRSHKYSSCLRMSRQLERRLRSSEGLTRAQAAYDALAATDPHLVELLGLDDTFLRRRQFYTRLGRALGRRDGSQRDRVLHALRWTITNVASDVPDHATGAGVLPELVILRGYANAAESAWVCCTLLEQVGVPACLVELLDEETGDVRHTLTAVEIDGAPYLIDTYLGVPPAEVGDGLIVPLDPSKLGRARLLLSCEAQSVLPQTWVMHRLANHARPTIALWYDVAGQLDRWAGHLFGEQPVERDALSVGSADGRLQIVLARGPFIIAARLPQVAYRSRIEPEHEFLSSLGHARTEQCLGRPGRALREFEEILSQRRIGKRERENAEYYRALCAMSGRGGPAAGKRLVDEFLAKHPESHWASHLRLKIAEKALAAGKGEIARDYLAGVGGPRKALAQHLLQRLDKGEPSLPRLRPAPPGDTASD